MSREGVAGFTVVELLVCLVLAAWLGVAALRGFALLRVGAERVIAASGTVEAHRMTRTVLRSELGAGTRGVDWWPGAPDSVRLRAFRAVALACGSASDSTVVVIPLSGRAVDPSKDSVLVLDAGGVWVAADLVSRSAVPACVGAAGESTSGGRLPERWRLRPPPDTPVLLRVFETGSYHVAGGALLYRRGAGGRQPLTEAALGAASLVDSAGVLRLVLPFEGEVRRQLELARLP